MKLQRIRRRGLLLSGAIALMAILALSTPLASARVYSGSAKSWPDTEPPCYAYLTVDTTAKTLELKWDGPSVIVLPWPGAYFSGSWHVWDDKGFDEHSDFGEMGRYGSETFNYYHTYTWVHVEVKWTYILASPVPTFLITTARIDIYVANEGTGSGGGGGGGFIWLLLR